MSRRSSSSYVNNLGSVIATVPNFPARLFLILLFVVLVLLVAVVGIILLFEVFTSDYDFIPALLQNSGLAVNEVWSHIGFDFPGP